MIWRQVLSQYESNDDAHLRVYRRNVDAIFTLVREGVSWSGHERDVFFLNNRDGTFSDVSGTSGVDFDQDGRGIALTDLDRDGDLEAFVKTRNGPGLRVLWNDQQSGNGALAIRLKGVKSNRDAIGTRVTVELASGPVTRALRAGEGFVSQNSKQLHFGLGDAKEIEAVRIRWPSGEEVRLQGVEPGTRISVVEGEAAYESQPLSALSPLPASPVTTLASTPPPYDGTWLIEPVPAPTFEQRDLGGKTQRLSDYQGRRVLLVFWASWCRNCFPELKALQQAKAEIEAAGGAVLAISVDKPEDAGKVQALARELGLEYPVMIASKKVWTEYNAVKRTLFDILKDMEVPSSILVDEKGEMSKIYVGQVDAGLVLRDLRSRATTREEFLARAVPYPGEFLEAPYRDWAVNLFYAWQAGARDYALTLRPRVVQ